MQDWLSIFGKADNKAEPLLLCSDSYEGLPIVGYHWDDEWISAETAKPLPFTPTHYQQLSKPPATSTVVVAEPTSPITQAIVNELKHGV
jgi:hypothetical protein